MNSSHKKAVVVGWPIDHSLSPALHNYWLNLYRLSGSYERLAVHPDHFVTFAQSLKDSDWVGLNLTVPYKEKILPFLDELDPGARSVGAVNTVVKTESGLLKGYNTDVYGFNQNLVHAGFVLRNLPVTILGSGGAARAASVALIEMGSPVVRIVSRNNEKAMKIRNTLGPIVEPFTWIDHRALDDCQLLVNATSLGLGGKSQIPLSFEQLPPSSWVMDMVYAPLVTSFLAEAQEKGHPTVDGLGMLLHQAKPAFQKFFGHDVEVTQALRSHLRKVVNL